MAEAAWRHDSDDHRFCQPERCEWAGEARPVVLAAGWPVLERIELYRGPPLGVSVSVSLIEHDHSDPEHFKENVDAALVAEWIRQRRLSRCRRDLLDPSHAARPLYATAAQWGHSERCPLQSLVPREVRPAAW